MFIHSSLLFLLSVLSVTTLAHPSSSPQITPTPITSQTLAHRTESNTAVTVSTKPIAYPSFCCAYNSLKSPDSATVTNYTLNFPGFGNTDASAAHTGTYPNSNALCAPGLDDAINAAFKNEADYTMTITCLPSYGGKNDTYVYLTMVVPTQDQGMPLLEVVRNWAPSWASPKWDDLRTLVPADATCAESASLCQPQQMPLGYCSSNC
ncbi:hypothetical protein SBOR_7881 [Sclerotinia borealis F-4128]|uniref:Uncharacterized protein n=1 Tax=Sclerotinia borealis (strain F-4128) TaxID=1432307 RepID=W9CB00_SCLBF|nr:hypothetical protein SBOR_7881 [Sclerotinia borealis F-4128]